MARLNGHVVRVGDAALEAFCGGVRSIVAVDAEEHDVMAAVALQTHREVLAVAVWYDPAWPHPRSRPCPCPTLAPLHVLIHSAQLTKADVQAKFDSACDPLQAPVQEL